MGLHHADVVVTEAGFGMDLGGEKFLDLKCRIAGLWPRMTVLVVTLRALRMHGGLSATAASSPDLAALERGFAHLAHHLDAIAAFGLPAVVAINRHGADPEAELAAVEAFCAARGASVARCDGFAAGGDGALALADVVRARLAEPAPEPQFTYPLEASILDKLRAIARRSYGADDVVLTAAAAKQAAALEANGAGNLPICVAKTPASLSDDPARAGRPTGFTITVRELRWSAGAGFVVALAGDIMTMPGLPRDPAARRVKVHADGRAIGLMQGS
jgi:formate--tetrahydrofolate ligase